MSVTATAPLLGIDGPLPIARQFSLLGYTDAEASRRLGGRFAAGVTVRPHSPMKPHGFDQCAASGSDSLKVDGAERANETFLPFTAYVADFCSGIGLGDWDEFKDSLDAVLLATESYAAERQLAVGDPIDTNPFLTDANMDTLGGGAVAPVEGLALLENEIAWRTAREGVIHMTPATATALVHRRVIAPASGILRTLGNWTPVVVGAGYIGALSPGTDQEWMFATGPVAVGRGELFQNPDDVADSLDRDLNDAVYRAERDMLVEWDAVLQLGVLIDRSSTP